LKRSDQLLCWFIAYFLFIILLCWSTPLLEQGLSLGKFLFWASIVGQGLAAVIILILWKLDYRIKLAIVFLYGIFIYLPIFFFSPRFPLFQDEVFHFQLFNLIYETGANTQPSSVYSIFPSYPGLELMGTYLANILGISTFLCGRLLILLIHSALLILVFMIIRKITDSERIAFWGAIIYTTNASYSFFDSVFSYESMGIFLFMLILYLLIKKNDAKTFIIVILSMCALIITHPFSSYHLELFLLIISLYFFTYLKDWSLFHKLVLYTALLCFWIACYAPMTISYFKSILLYRKQLLLSTPIFGVRGSYAFSPLPFYELFMNRYVYTILIVAGCIFGLIMVYKNRDLLRQRIAGYSLICYGVVLYLLTLPLTLKNGNDAIFRSWPFFFAGIALLSGISLDLIWKHLLNIRGWKSVAGCIILLIAVGSLIMGGYGLGAGSLLLTRPLQVYASGPDAITADVFSCSDWFARYAGRNKIIYSDKTIQFVFGNIQNVDLVKSREVFLADRYVSDRNKNSDVYVLVDIRITQRPASYSTYFDGSLPFTVDGDTQRYGLEKPLPIRYIEKFDDSVWLDDIYDNGNLHLYH